jgi:broad specificity phosphatase PhoE
MTNLSSGGYRCVIHLRYRYQRDPFIFQHQTIDDSPTEWKPTEQWSPIVNRDGNSIEMEALSGDRNITLPDEHERESARGRVVTGPRVFLVRHAHAKEGPKDPEQGRHLSAIGERQAQALARRLAKWQIDAIVCSDLHRARETAAAVHAFHPNVPMIVDATFREVSAGTLAAFEQEEPGEAGLGERLDTAWEKVVNMPYRVTVLIIHNGLIKYLLGRTIKYEGSLKPRFHSAETGITAIQVKPKGQALIQFFNDTHHLSPELVLEKKPWLEDAETGRWYFGPEEEAEADQPDWRETALD